MNIDLKDTVYWREQKSTWESSGLSQRSYCKQEGLSYQKFNYHIRKLNDKALLPAFKFIEAPRTILVTKDEEEKQRPVRVELPNGVSVVLELSVALSLSQVIKAAGAV